jgi:cell division protein FtsI/penicillin-binding protein 2
VRLVAKPAASLDGSPSPSPSSEPTASASPAPARTVFESKPVPGKDLSTSLSIPLQKLAEKTLSTTKPASAIVAIRPSTGEILAAANGPGSDDLSVSTVGRYPPGSTFKVVSSLALLRAGLKPSSPVSCPATVTVDGKRFKNYSDYPSDQLGKINLRTALAQSCNTAFIGQRGELSGSELADAAGSLGLGIDYDVGFPSYFGSVPPDSSSTGRAAAMIGQGKVLASPMAMAAVVASVSAGKTVVPQLIEGTTAAPKGKPLTEQEADDLRAMMRAVVSAGSGRVLRSVQGPTVIAKTGTAEYGPKAPFRTHAWMIAAQGDLAVAVFVRTGSSGSHTAGPLLATFLSGAR